GFRGKHGPPVRRPARYGTAHLPARRALDANGRVATLHWGDVSLLCPVSAGPGTGARGRVVGGGIHHLWVARGRRAGAESAHYGANARGGAGARGGVLLGNPQLCHLLGLAGGGCGMVSLRPSIPPVCCLYARLFGGGDLLPVLSGRAGRSRIMPDQASC